MHASSGLIGTRCQAPRAATRTRGTRVTDEEGHQRTRGTRVADEEGHQRTRGTRVADEQGHQTQSEAITSATKRRRGRHQWSSHLMVPNGGQSSVVVGVINGHLTWLFRWWAIASRLANGLPSASAMGITCVSTCRGQGRPPGQQGSSAVTSGHQRSSEVIRGHPGSAEVIRGHQRSSVIS